MPYIKPERRIELDPIVREMNRSELSPSDVAELLRSIAGVVERCDYMPNYKSVADKIDLTDVRPNGDLNYILFKYVKYYIKPSYNNYKSYIGALHTAIDSLIHVDYTNDYRDEYRESAAEIRRKLLAPYEDLKIEENGDV